MDTEEAFQTTNISAADSYRNTYVQRPWAARYVVTDHLDVDGWCLLGQAFELFSPS